MSQPEIARRCPTCGASIREVSLFCPQCGKQLPKRDLGETQPLGSALNSQAEKTAPLSPRAANDSAVEPGMETRKNPPVSPMKQSPKQAQQRPKKEAAVKGPATEARGSVGQAARGAVGARIQRATTLARGVEGNVTHRVQKVREISSVVIDEAGDDPSLRFVLVAAVLFVLFLIIVVLNKFIT
jgi:endogenous inhibitor of DNA gyrase (YacG/DUF329 family)